MSRVNILLLRRYSIGICAYYIDRPVEGPPDDLGVFDAAAADVRKQAEEAGDLESLALVFDSVLVHDDDWLEERFEHDLSEIVDVEPGQSAETLKTILLHYRRRIWPDAKAPVAVPDLEFVFEPVRRQ